MASGVGLKMREPMEPVETDVARENHGSQSADLNAAWLAFIRYCRQLGHGEIEKLKIQDGLPVLAEQAIRKIKF